MRRLIYVLNLFLLLAAAASCAKEIVMDPEEEPIVFVECVLTEEPVQTLKLGLTKGASMTEAPVITEAEAVLTDLTMKTEVGRFERKDDGTWTLDYAALPDHSYRLEVSVPGHDLVWAEQTMPDKCDVSSINAELTDLYTTFTKRYVGTVVFLDHCPQATWISALNYNPETMKREPVEFICTDAPYADNFNLTGGTYEPHSEPWLGFRYDYISEKYVEDEAGIFYHYLYEWLRGYPLHRGYLRFETGSLSEDDIIKHPIYIAGSFTGNYYDHVDYLWETSAPPPPEDDEGVMIASVVSDDYDKYLRDAIIHQQLKESGDLSSIHLRENIYSNINGGLGIFGAKTEKYLKWRAFYSIDKYRYAEATDSYWPHMNN